jgi:hypothetical protein
MSHRRGKRLLQLGVMLAIVLDTARRIFVYGPKPIYIGMMALEILIVLLILYEIIFGGEVLPKWKMKRRVRSLFDLVSRGQVLHKTVPGFSFTGPSVSIKIRGEWEANVASWTMDTNRILKACSTQASMKFLDDSSFQPAREYESIEPALWERYDVLNHRLSNLQAIMQYPEVYLL